MTETLIDLKVATISKLESFQMEAVTNFGLQKSINRLCLFTRLLKDKNVFTSSVVQNNFCYKILFHLKSSKILLDSLLALTKSWVEGGKIFFIASIKKIFCCCFPFSSLEVLNIFHTFSFFNCSKSNWSHFMFDFAFQLLLLRAGRKI